MSAFAHVEHLRSRRVLEKVGFRWGRYPDDVLFAVLLEHGGEHLRSQTLRALEDALKRVTSC